MKKILSGTVLILFFTLSISITSNFVFAFNGFVRDDFIKINENGFGDDQNAYAWSMEHFKGDVYVGTGRLSTTLCIMAELIYGAIGESPPDVPDIDCPPFLQKWLGVGLRVTNLTAYHEWRNVSKAEIWRYHDGAWEMVYQSDMVRSVLRRADGSLPLPVHPDYNDYFTPRATGFRSMAVLDGVLYAGIGGLNFAFSPTLILMSTDGINWTKVNTPLGMGTNTRAMSVHNGKLYVGTQVGNVGSIWRLDNPSTGAWTNVLDFNLLDKNNSDVVALASFNGYLYIGTQNINGFQVWRSTVANPSSSSDWKKIVSDGAVDRFNAWAGTMKEFKGQLYVGTLGLPVLSGYFTLKGFDLIRINPDDSWELVIGPYFPRDPPTGPPYPIPESFWPSGFGNPLNFYCWSMEVHNDFDGEYLYLGTFDASVFLRYLITTLSEDEMNELLTNINNMKNGITPEQKELILEKINEARSNGHLTVDQVNVLKNFWTNDHEIVVGDLELLYQIFAGADLWKTNDGLHWIPVTLNGFDNPNNYGFRTQKFAPNTLYVGTSNPWQGLEVWRTEHIRKVISATPLMMILLLTTLALIGTKRIKV